MLPPSSGVLIAIRGDEPMNVDCEQFWQEYRVMSGIIFVLLAIEILIFGVLGL